MAGLGTGAPIVKVYHEKSIILPDVSRVLACLYEKEIDFTRETFSSYKSLLRLQASGHVPVPFYDGPNKFLEESREICRHIAETYEDHGYPFLLGKDSLERASIEEWLHHEEHNFNPPSRSLFCHLAFPVAEEDDDIDLQTRKLEDVLEVYEQRLGDSEFLAGNKFTLADLVHLPNSYHITNSEKFLYLYDSRKNVQRWWHDISSRGSWQKVLKVMHEVERQNKQEELDKQQQRKQEELEKQQQRQWRRQHPPTSRSPFRLDSREQPSTKPHTILVRPPASIIAPKAPQAEEPHPTETSRDETPVSSSISIPTTHKAPDIRSKHTIISTTHEERPPASLQSTPRIPEKSPIPVERRINFFTPATSPITEKPSRNGADKSRIRDAPLPSEATEIDLPTKSKPSSSKKASDNLHDFYEASRHTDEAEPYTGSISQKPSEMLDEISETDGPSNAIDHAETSPRSAKEDSDRLRTSGFWTENTAPTADTQDKKSVRYTERTSQRPVGNISSRATDQRVTYTSPEKPHSTEAHQKLQSEQWHAAVAGFPADRRKDASLPKGARDDTQAIPLHDDDTNQEARETASAPRQTRAQDPYDTSEGTSSRSQPISAPHDAVPPPKQATSEGPYARKDVVEARRFHVDRRKDAPLPKRVRDDTQANPLYDDDDDTNQEARETASAPRRARAQDPYDTSEGIGTYHSSSSRPHPVNAPHDAVPPPKQAASEGSRRATTPYLAAQEVFQQGKKSPASRLIVPHDAQGSTEEETVESSSKAHPLDSHLADVRPPNQFLDEDGYGAITPLQTGDTDDPYNEKRDRGVAAPKRMMSQDAFEETKMTDSAAFEAQTSDHWQADAPPQKQRPTEDPETTASPSKKRYTDDEDTAKQAKHAHQKLQSEQWHAATTGLSKLKGEADDLMPPTQQAKPSKDVQHISPQDAEQANTWPLAQEPAGMDGQLVQGPERTARTPHTDKRRDVSSMLWRQAADVQGIAEDRASSDQGGAVRPPYAPKDTAEARIVPAALRKDASFPKHAQDKTQAAPLYDDDHDTNQEARETASAPRRTTTPQDAVHPPKQAVFEGPRRATTPYPAAQEIMQARRSPASRSTVPHDAQGSTEEETLEETKFVESASSRAQPVEDTSEEAETRNSALFRRPSPDAWPAAAPPSKEAAAEDALRVSQSSPARYPRAEETSKQPRAPVSIPTHIAAQDARDVFREPNVADSTPLQKRYPDAKDVAKKSKISDSAPPRGQPLDSQRADAPSWKKEAADAPSRGQPLYSQRADAPSWKKEATEDPRATSAFDKTRPYVEDSTRQAADTDFGPRQIGDEHTEEKKVADSAPSVRERHTYTPRTARPLSQLAEEEEDAQDKYREGRETARPLSQQAEEEEDVQDKDREGMETVSAPKKMVSRDAHDTYGERRTPHSTSTSPTPSKAQPADSRSPIKVERPRSVYEEDHLVGQDSHKQPQTLPTGGRADGSTLKHQQDPVVPSISEEKSSTPPAPPRARVRDDHPTEDPFKGDIVGDRKGAPPQLGQEPISQVQRATELSQEAAPDGELSTIDQWRRTSVPLQGDDVLGGSTIDQKPTPMSEQSIPSARRANEMVKKEQRMVPPARTGAQTPDVQRAPSSFSRADTAERDREPVQMQAPTQHARPTSVPTRRATPDARDTSDQEFANKSDAQRWNALKAKHDLAMTSEDDRNASPSTHDAAVDNKTALPASEAQGSDTWPGSTATPVNAQPTSGDARVGRFSRAQGAQPPESTQAQTPFDAPRDSVSTPDVPRDTLDKTKSAKPTSTEGMTPTAAAPTSKVQLAEQKFAPSDKKLAPAAPESSKEDTSFSAPEKPQTIFRQEARPSAAITKQVPSSDAHHDRKIQHVTLAKFPPDDSPMPDQDSIQSAQQSSSSETSKEETIVAAAGPTLPTTVDKDTQVSGRPIKAERTPSVYQEDHLVAQDSHEQPQTLPTVGKADGSTPKRQQDPEEKPSTTPAPSRVRVSDGHPTEEPFKGDIVDDRKRAPPLLGQEPTSQVQRATELSQEAAPDGDMSSKPSTIDQWRRTSVPIQGTSNSGDDVLGGSTIDQKPTPMSQQSIPGARGASEVVEKEQKMAPTARPGARTPDALSAPSSFSAANTAERDAEPVQMQAPTLHDQGAQPPESTQAQSPFDAPRDSVSTQDVPSDALDKTNVVKPTSTEGKAAAPTFKAQLAEEKFAPSDKKLGRAARPTSTEGMTPTAGPAPTSKAQLPEQKFAPSDNKPEKPQTIFRQEASPSAPITKQVPSSDAHHDTRKIQQATLDNVPTDDSSIPPFPSHEQVSHAPQAFPSKKDRAPAPGTKDSPASNTQIASAKVQETMPDNYGIDELTVPSVSSEKQGSYAGSSTEPHEGSFPDAYGATDDKDITKYPSRQAPVLEYRPDSTPADSYVRPISGSEVFPAVKKSAPSDKDSIQSAQQPSPAETRKEETIFAAAEPTLPTTVSKDTQVSRRPIKAERTPSAYQEDHLVAQDSHEQPQTLPTGGRADDSTPKRQQDPKEKSSTPPAPPRARVRDDHPTEEPFNGDTVDEQKVAPPLLGQEPTSQVQRATELSQEEAAPDGDMSSKPSTIGQWQRTSVPLQAITPNSGDDVLGRSTIDQKPTPMSEQSIPSARGASEMVEKEQRMAPPARPGARTPDVLNAPSSFSAADRAERDGEPVQMQAPTLHDQGAQPPESTQAQSPFDAPRDSVSTQDVPSDALDKTNVAKPTSTEGKAPTPTSKAQLAEEKFAPSDKKLARAARPTSTESMPHTAGPAPSLKAQLSEQNFAPSDKKPEKPQTIFRQEARPSVPITKQVPSSDAHHGTRKIQQVTLDNVPTDDSSIPPFPSHEQVSHAPQAFPSKKDRAPAPGTKDSPASNTQIASAKVQETMPDNYRTDELTVPSVSSERQGSYAGSSTEPHEGSSPDAYGAADDKDITKYPSRQAPVLEYRPDSTPADSYVRPISGSEVFPAVKKSAPSDQDSIQSAQQPSPAETRKEETIFAAAGPTLPTTVSEDTQVSRRPIMAERTPFAYQEDHLVAQDSHEQPQTLPTGGRADDSRPKRQQDPKEKSSTPPAPPRDDHPTEEPFNRDTVDEQKGAPTLLGQEPTSQVQRATELSQEEAAPDGDMSSEPSTIGQWQRTSVPLQGITPNSGDDVLGGSTIDQKPTPMSEQTIPSARGASEMVEKEQRMAPPARPGARTPDVLSAPSSFSAADRAERDGEPVQMQAPTLHDQGAQPPESTQAQSPFDAPRDSVSTQDVPSDALDKTNVAKPTSTEGKAAAPTFKAQLAEEKFAPSDKKPEKPQTIFRQEARPSAPITKQVPSSDAHHDTRKIQQVTLDNVPTDDSSIPPFPSHEQVSHAPQAFPSKKDRAPAPGTKDSPASNTQIASAKVQDTMPDNYRTDELTVPSVSSERQGSYAGSSTEPHAGSSPDAYGAADAKDITKYPSRQAPVLEYMPDSTPVDSYVRPISGSEVFPAVKKSAPSDQDSIQSAKQPSPAETKKEETIVAAAEPTLPTIVGKDTEGMRGTPTFDYEPTGDKRADIQSGRSDEVALPEQKSGPSDRDSARSTQSRSSAEPMDKELNYPSSAKPLSSATPDQTKDSQPTIGQQAPAPGTSEYPSSEPLSVVERNEKITVAEAESKVSRPVIAQQDVKHVPGISEPALDNVSTEEEYQRASEPREGPPPDVHGTLVDRKTAPSSSQVQSPDAKRDVLPLSVDVAKKTVPPSSQAQILPSSVDVGPSSDEQSTTRLRRDQEAQAQLPAATKKPPPFETPVYSKSNQDAPKSFKLPSGDQDVMSPKVVPASASDTQFGKVSDEITDDGQNSPLSAQDIARSAQRPSFVEPTEEDGIVAASDQTNEARPISGQRGITPTPDKQRIPDLRGAVDEKMSLPSSQAQKSDIRPDSAPIDDDVHRTSGDEPATSSVRDSQARPPAGIQNVPAGFLEKTKSPRPLSTDQEPTASPAPAPDAPQDQDSNHSSQFSPSVVSRKDVANADQTNVSQAGLREPPSSDAKLPSEEIQESSPDAYLTKSEKPLPMKDPVRPPHDASFDLSSGEKPTRIKGDQASTISDGSPSASEEVGQSKNGAVKGPLAAELVSSFPQKNLEKTSPEEKWNHQQQTDQSTTRSSEDNNIEASGTRNPNTSTTSRDIQPSPLKERMQAVEGSRNQQQSGQAVFQSIQDNRTQIQETKARDTAFDKPEVIRPDSAPTSGDAHRTSGDVPTTSSLRDSQAQPSAGTENVPAAYSEKESPRPLSTDQEVRTPLTMTNPTPAPDSPQDQYSNHASQFTPSVVSRKNAANADKTNISEAGLRGPASSDATPSEQIQESRPDDYLTKSEKELPMKGTDPVQPPEVAAFDLPSNGKPTMIKGDQVNTISSVSLSASKPVGQSESSVERPLSDELVSPFPEKHLEKRSPEEKSNQQQQTDQSSTRLTKDDSTESSGIASPNILTTSGDIQPSPLKQNNQAAERSRKQQQADPVFQSTQDNKRQTEETEAQDTGSDQHEEINPDSAPTSGDANRTSGDGPATSSLRNSQAQPPAETQNAPAVFSEKIKSPRLPSTDQELVTPLTSPAPTPDTPQDKDSIRSPQLPPPVESRRDIANTDQTDVSPAGLRETTSSDAMPPSEKIQESSPDAYLSKSEKPILPLTGTDTVQPPVEGSFDLSGDGKPTMIKGDQANTKSNVSLSPSQADSQSENSAVKGAPSDDSVSPFPQKNLERTSPEEKPKQQQQSSTRSPRDDSIEASETASPNILTTSGDIQPSPLNQPSPMKENIQAAEGFRNQQQADQDVFQPRQDNRKQIEEPEPQDTSTDYPEDTNGASQRAASEQQQGENVGRVQRQRNDTNNSYEPTKDAPSIIQADNKPESSSRTPEEPRQQAQPEGKTRGGEIMSPASETGQPEESDLPPSKKGRTNQSQSETSAKLEDQTPSATRNRGTNSSKLDGATDDTKSADTDDNNPSS
ncbi:microtubule-associated protein futsch isoform X3 [Triticum aestivum]|uniref:microtubule-associated protein futsch isoform X3 n=1 Tax=Triticum aestivum TaxID=4565 RepID=UPI001D016040|nr:microtubule-associated protein futsch-like isoform X3 [Triticum aestivum]